MDRVEEGFWDLFDSKAVSKFNTNLDEVDFYKLEHQSVVSKNHEK